MPSNHRTAERGRHGRVVPNVKCPKCGGDVEYNGNYFCSYYPNCDWALSHGEDGEPVGKKDKAIWAAIKEEWQL